MRAAFRITLAATRSFDAFDAVANSPRISNPGRPSHQGGRQPELSLRAERHPAGKHRVVDRACDCCCQRGDGLLPRNTRLAAGNCNEGTHAA